MNRRSANNRVPGFTLVELLVVTVIMSVISIVIYSTFSSGARIWKRTNSLDSNEDVNMFFDRFGQDVGNGFNFTGIAFEGKADRFQIPTIVTSARMGARSVGLAVYSCSDKVLSRSVSDYSQIYEESQIPARNSLTGISACKFSYYQFDPEKKEYSWVEEWQKKSLPLAIRVEFALGQGENPVSFIKTVSIPVSSKADQ
ncbi:MAG: prepilin-type N-terminal cleavage/methylation domain-containing protein [Candidatus Omnitrophica bacterium]|jgi:prepilin-type N-terminal cleavage/methylation domain-containing protein|nr:prepilin-type N-terminal cleavage/methylation domain-containing protein [Candidatus Omnitrophota bacterium]